jgi:hypothetical protein
MIFVAGLVCRSISECVKYREGKMQLASHQGVVDSLSFKKPLADLMNQYFSHLVL